MASATAIHHASQGKKTLIVTTDPASKELETIGIKSGQIIINGIMPEAACELEFFRKKYEAQKQVIKETEAAILKSPPMFWR